MSGLAGGPCTLEVIEEMAALVGRGEPSVDNPAGAPALAVVQPRGAAAGISNFPESSIRVALAADAPLTLDGAPAPLSRLASTYATDPRALARVEGRFALAIHDTAKDRLVLACDRSGSKAIFWTHVAGALYFATSLKALLAVPGLERRLDEVAVDEWVAHGFNGGTRTLLAGVHRLPAGHELVSERGATTIRALAAAATAESVDPVGELDVLLSDSVRARLAAAPEAGCFLNGSVDSSVVLALLKEQSAGRVQTFAADWAGSDGDREAARRIARAFDTDHHELEVSAPSSLDLIELTWLLDLPISTPSVYATYALSALAREHVGRVFSGQGASQLFGRRPAPLAGLKALLARLPGCRHLAAVTADEPALFDARARQELYAPDLRGRLARALARSDDALPLTAAGSPLRGTKPLKLGRATRAQAVDLELPYLDPRVIDWAARLQADTAPRAHVARDALREVARRLLPDWVVDGEGAKRSLPISDWLRGPLSSFAATLLGEPYVRHQGLFDPQALARLCASVRTGSPATAARVWRLMAFQLWYLVFLEDEDRARELISRARQTDRIPVRAGSPVPPLRA